MHVIFHLNLSELIFLFVVSIDRSRLNSSLLLLSFRENISILESIFFFFFFLFLRKNLFIKYKSSVCNATGVLEGGRLRQAHDEIYSGHEDSVFMQCHICDTLS